MKSRRTTAMSAVFLAAVAMALGALTPAFALDGTPAAPPLAQDDEGTAVFGTIEDDEDAPQPGVAITVASEDEAFEQRVETDANGDWRVDLPGPGTYTITIDEQTLPEGVRLKDPSDNPATISVREGRQRRILFPMGEAGVGGIEFAPFLRASLSGVKFGLIIAITSIGLSLVFGTTGLINFAHGEFVALGAVVAWFLNVRSLRLHIVLAALLAALIVGLFAGGLEKGLFSRLRDRRVGGFQFLVITIGLSLLMRHALLLWFGSRRGQYAQYTLMDQLNLGPLAITPRDLGVMILSVLVLVAVGMMLQRTRLGKAMRAVADNPDLAESSGIDVARVVLWIWVVGGSLAGLGGVFQGLVATVEWSMGFRLLLLMFAGVILGGLGTAYGAMVGGLVVGYVSEVSTVWLNAELKLVWALIVLIVVLLVRPQGIMGVKERVG